MLKIMTVCGGLLAAQGCMAGTVDAASPPLDAVERALEEDAPAPDATAAGVAPAGQRDAAASASAIAWLPDAVANRAAAIDVVADAQGVDPRLVAIIMLVESRGEASAVSPVGARGLMQIMPMTAAAIARAHALPEPTTQGLMDPDTNLQLGVLHLADLIAEFGDPALDRATVHRVATAYNGGQEVVLGEREASEETQRYAARVGALWRARDAPSAPNR